MYTSNIMSSQKSKLGQFFTTNCKYILQNFTIPDDVSIIIEPFAGNCDIFEFIENKEKYIFECYDIDPKKNCVIKQNTLIEVPDYENKYIITNPPYLARNKSPDKHIFDKYETNDLYKCFLKSIINSKCLGGMLIIPLNFWCSIRKQDIELRRMFLESFEIVHVNVFEEQVFNDTTCTVCSIQFKQGRTNDSISFSIYPSNKTLSIKLSSCNNWTIGGEIYELSCDKNIKVSRLIRGVSEPNTNILAKCIDDNENNKICLKMVRDEDIFYDDTPKKSARTYASLVIYPELSITQQEQLVEKFNGFLDKKRQQYHSLFLTNFRESKDLARKRISFDLLYQIVSHILSETID